MKGYEYFKKFLDEENFRYDEDEDTIICKYQGWKYVGWKNDSPYFQLTVVFFDVDNSNINKCLRAANELNNEIFIIKTTVRGDSVWCNYEFIPNESFDSEFFLQIMHQIVNACDKFNEKMKNN